MHPNGGGWRRRNRVMKSLADDLVDRAEIPHIADGIAAAQRTGNEVESRMGAVAWGHWPAPRFPSPLIEPDVRSYRIRLSDWLHPRPTAGQVGAGVLGTALRGSDGSHRTRTDGCRALPLCAVWRESRARAHGHI